MASASGIFILPLGQQELLICRLWVTAITADVFPIVGFGGVLRIIRKRQKHRRIDPCEIIVVERFATFHHYQRQGVQGMTSAELKHQAKLREWATAIQDCRSSGLSVRRWCRERGVATATYYRWEREVLSIASATPELPEPTSSVAFAELPNPKQPCRNIVECSATLRIGDASLELHQEMTPDLLKALVEVLRSC
jgi:transposase-like protein